MDFLNFEELINICRWFESLLQNWFRRLWKRFYIQYDMICLSIILLFIRFIDVVKS